MAQQWFSNCYPYLLLVWESLSIHRPTKLDVALAIPSSSRGLLPECSRLSVTGRKTPPTRLSDDRLSMSPPADDRLAPVSKRVGVGRCCAVYKFHSHMYRVGSYGLRPRHLTISKTHLCYRFECPEYILPELRDLTSSTTSYGCIRTSLWRPLVLWKCKV